MAKKADSHLSTGSKEGNEAPVRQHHRLAVGEKVSGETNPNGAPVGDKAKKIANAKVNY